MTKRSFGGYCVKNIGKKFNIFLFPLLICGGLLSPFYALAQEEMVKKEQEIEDILNNLDSMQPEIERTVNELEQRLQKQEQNEVRNRNRIIWSIPAAFSEDTFDESVKDLHANVPFYGKVSLGNDAYQKYKEWIESNKDKEMRQTEAWTAKGSKARQDYQDFLLKTKEQLGNSVADQKLKDLWDKHLQSSDMHNAYAPGVHLYDYLSGQRLLGLGLYRSDLNEIAFLAANMASGYLLFQDIKKNKIEKIKAVVNIHKDELIGLIEKVKDTSDKKLHAQAKQEMQAFIKKNCALFGYNPCKSEIIVPVAKYIFLQRIIENIKMEKEPDWSFNPDSHFGFIKNEAGELVKSGVTPISLVALSKYFVAPVAGLSETTSETLGKFGKRLRLADRLFGNIHLPAIFYRWFASIAGEALVLMIAIKVMDNYFNEQLLTAFVSDAEKWLAVLKEAQGLDALEQLTPEQLVQQEKLGKEIEKALSSGKTGFRSWIEAQRATFMKITIAGFLGIIVPTLVIKGAPLVMNMIKHNGGLA